jgi:hypothetical protein
VIMLCSLAVMLFECFYVSGYSGVSYFRGIAKWTQKMV